MLRRAPRYWAEVLEIEDFQEHRPTEKQRVKSSRGTSTRDVPTERNTVPSRGELPRISRMKSHDRRTPVFVYKFASTGLPADFFAHCVIATSDRYSHTLPAYAWDSYRFIGIPIRLNVISGFGLRIRVQKLYRLVTCWAGKRSRLVPERTKHDTDRTWDRTCVLGDRRYEPGTHFYRFIDPSSLCSSSRLRSTILSHAKCLQNWGSNLVPYVLLS